MLSKRDDETVERLIITGLPKNMAKALVFLSNRGETTSVDVEKGTGLRQPEVSIAMQALRRRKWVTKRDIKKEGKGRPVHSYRLARPLGEIVDEVEAGERKKIEEIEENLRRLRMLTG
jgi:predicted transcriptional regulator